MGWNKEKLINEILLFEKKLKRRPVKRDNSNLFFLAKKHFGSWNNLMKAAGHETKNFRKAEIPELKSNELYYFIGLLCSDGHIQFMNKKGNNKINIYTSYEEERDMIIKLMKYLFNYDASVRARDYGFSSERLNYEIHIYSKEACEFFINIGIPYGAKSLILKVPEMMFNHDDEKVWHFIRGVFDGDGSIVTAGKYKYNLFKICSGSKDFILGFNEILEERGFSPRINQDGKIWLLRLNKQEEVKKLFKIIYKDSEDYFYPRKRLKWGQQYI